MPTRIASSLERPFLEDSVDLAVLGAASGASLAGTCGKVTAARVQTAAIRMRPQIELVRGEGEVAYFMVFSVNTADRPRMWEACVTEMSEIRELKGLR